MHLHENLSYLITLDQGSQPVVREGLPGGTRVTSIFHKSLDSQLLVHVSGFVSKYINFPVACYSYCIVTIRLSMRC